MWCVPGVGWIWQAVALATIHPADPPDSDEQDGDHGQRQPKCGRVRPPRVAASEPRTVERRPPTPQGGTRVVATPTSPTATTAASVTARRPTPAPPGSVSPPQPARKRAGASSGVHAPTRPRRRVRPPRCCGCRRGSSDRARRRRRAARPSRRSRGTDHGASPLRSKEPLQRHGYQPQNTNAATRKHDCARRHSTKWRANTHSAASTATSWTTAIVRSMPRPERTRGRPAEADCPTAPNRRACGCRG